MKITKRNGNITVYDDQKIISSILKANKDSSDTGISANVAANLAGEVFSRLTADNEIISTKDVRDYVYALLVERGFSDTARRYAEYKKL